MSHGVLDPVHHRRLIADMDRYARRAGVSVDAICSNLSEYAEHPSEADWVRAVLEDRDDLPHGLVYLGARRVARRMEGLAGALVRNFVDARVVTVSQVMEDVECSVMLVPNFCTRMPEWKAAEVADRVLERYHAGWASVLAVPEWSKCEAVFGADLTTTLREAFTTVGRQ